MGNFVQGRWEGCGTLIFLYSSELSFPIWTLTLLFHTQAKGALEIPGPLFTKYQQENLTVANPTFKPVPYSECGTGTAKVRVDLTLKKTKPGAKGLVAGEPTSNQGVKGYYGVQVGFANDWVRCE